MLPVLGGDSPLRQTDRELEPSLVALRDVDSVMLPVSSTVEDADDKLFEYVLTNTEHSLNELLPDRRHELIYSLRLGGMISRLVVDHIAYLTAISLLYRLLFKGSY